MHSTCCQSSETPSITSLIWTSLYHRQFRPNFNLKEDNNIQFVFLKSSWPLNFLRKKVRVAAQGKVECLISHLLTWRGRRTYGRKDGSDVITNTKTSGIDGLQNFVGHGATFVICTLNSTSFMSVFKEFL